MGVIYLLYHKDFVVVYEVVKWGVAIAAAPISGGASLVGATLVP